MAMLSVETEIENFLHGRRLLGGPLCRRPLAEVPLTKLHGQPTQRRKSKAASNQKPLRSRITVRQTPRFWRNSRSLLRGVGGQTSRTGTASCQSSGPLSLLRGSRETSQPWQSGPGSATQVEEPGPICPVIYIKYQDEKY